MGVLLAGAFLPVVAGKATLLPLQPGVLPGGPFGYSGPRPAPAVLDPAASALKYLPVTRLASEEWRAGRLPFWNDYAGAGIPLWANAEGFATAPMRLPLYMAPTPAMWNIYWLGRLLLAGVLAFLLASSLGLSLLPALTAGAGYMLSGYLVQNLNLFHLDLDVLLPGLLLAFDRLLLAPSRPAFLLAALATGCMALGGNPQAYVVDLFLLAAWLVFRISALPFRARARGSLRAGLALSLGFAGALPQLVPLLEFMGRAHHIHAAGGSRSGMAALPPDALLSLLGSWTPGSAFFYYAGTTVVLLACLGGIAAWVGRARNIPAGAFRLLGIVALVECAKIAGLPGLNELGKLPVLEQVWFAKYAAPLFLSLALLAGFGAAFLAGKAGKWGLPVAVAALALVAGELVALRPGPFPAPFDPLKPAPYIGWLQEKQAQDPQARICGVGTALMPMTSVAFRLRDVRMEDTLIDRDQYKILFDGISAPKEPRMSMWIILDALDSRRLGALQELGVKWLVAPKYWRPRPEVAGSLSPAYQQEVWIWRVAGSKPFPGFPVRGRGALMIGFLLFTLLVPALAYAGFKYLPNRDKK